MAELGAFGKITQVVGGGSTGGITSGFTPQGAIGIVMVLFALAILGMSAWIVFNISRKWAGAHIFETNANGSIEFKRDTIRKIKHKKTLDILYKLAKYKDVISEDTARRRYRFKNGYICPLIRGEDGHLRPLSIVKDYWVTDANGEEVLVPFMHPVDNGLKDHIWHDMKLTTQKYKLTSTMEKLAPYATFALVAVLSMMMWYVTNGR